ncbi:MAG: thioesterase [Myxococcota bacterium]
MSGPPSLPEGCHREEFTLRSYDLDWSGRVSLRAIGGFLQEAARVHAEAIGAGITWLEQQNLSWALHRMKIEILQEPELKETVQVVTWASDADRLYAYRDFEMLGQNGKVYVQATSGWVLFDVFERKARRLLEEFSGIKIAERPRAATFGRKKPPELETAEIRRPFRVRMGDIDANGHTNNGRYMEWMVESVPSDIWNTHRLRALELVYREECLYDDELMVETQRVPGHDTFLHRTLRVRDGAELARGESRWITSKAMSFGEALKRSSTPPPMPGQV